MHEFVYYIVTGDNYHYGNRFGAPFTSDSHARTRAKQMNIGLYIIKRYRLVEAP